jgi:hypothetical protein
MRNVDDQMNLSVSFKSQRGAGQEDGNFCRETSLSLDSSTAEPDTCQLEDGYLNGT